MTTSQPTFLIYDGQCANPSSPQSWDHSDFDQQQPDEEALHYGEWQKIHYTNSSQFYQNSPVGQNVENSFCERDIKMITETPISPPSDLSAIRLSQSSSSMNENGRNSRKERRPDRKLYNVRGKQAQNEARFRPDHTLSSNTTFSKDSTRESLFDRLVQMDDDERDLKTKEASSLGLIPQSQSPSQPSLLLNIYLERKGEGEMISIYDDLTDYESFLEEVCKAQDITDKTALHFKINLMKMVHAVHPNPEQIEVYLNRLLDMNYQIIMEELYRENRETETVSFDYFDESEDCNNSNELINQNQSLNASQVQI